MKKLTKLAIQVRDDVRSSFAKRKGQGQPIMRRKKSRNNCIAGKNQANSVQRQTEYRPLKTGYFKSDLQKGWQETLERYHYDLFVTLTFREDIEHWKAKKRFEKWLGSLNNKLFGWRYRRKGLGIWGAVAYEAQNRGTLHMHVLMGAEGLKELNMDYMAKLWKCNGQRDRNGNLLDRIVNGHAVIKIYDPTMNAIKYMTKHIDKGGEIEMIVPRKVQEGNACSIETSG